MAEEGRRIERILNGIAGELVGVLQFRVWQAITTAMPVDIGFARSSVTPTIGSPLTTFLDRPRNVGTKENPGPGRSAATSEAAARLALNRNRAQAIEARYRIGNGPAFITVGADYGVYLNAGSSPQAKPMFIERAAEEAVLSLRNFRPRRTTG